MTLMMMMIMMMMIVGTTGCGRREIRFRLEFSSLERLDPLRSTDIVKVRLLIDGTKERDDAAIDIPVAEADLQRDRIYAFDADVYEDAVGVRALGFDLAGNVVGFGRLEGIDPASEVVWTVPFRRNLAYLIHRGNAAYADPQRFLYVLDVGTRVLVEKLELPGEAPEARGIAPWGGQAMLVLYQDQGRGVLGVLSTDDHRLDVIELPRAQDRVVAAAGHPIAVVAGNDLLTFVDLERRSVIDSLPLGGRPVDGVMGLDGRKAVFVMDQVAIGGVIVVDVEGASVGNQDIVTSPSGIALDPSGRVAYVTSSVERAVVSLDLGSGRATRFSPGLASPSRGGAAYSEEMGAVFAPEVGGRRLMGLAVSACADADRSGSRSCAPGLSSVVDILPPPVAVVADGSGRRVMVVGAGTSSSARDSGITFVETYPPRVIGLGDAVRLEVTAPEASRTLYPLDPEDVDSTYGIGRRYQPSGAAIVYGR